MTHANDNNMSAYCGNDTRAQDCTIYSKYYFHFKLAGLLTVNLYTWKQVTECASQTHCTHCITISQHHNVTLYKNHECIVAVPH